jgi:hypothetical protein
VFEQSARRWHLGCWPYALAVLYRFTHRNLFWYSFLLEAEEIKGQNEAGSIIEKEFNDLIGT